LTKLNELQRDPIVSFKIIEDDVEEEADVDDKLIALALRTDAPILTIDFPMNQVARAQGATVLNINALANAVRSVYIPGETFALRVAGRQRGKPRVWLPRRQHDGNRRKCQAVRGSTIYVEVTELINRKRGGLSSLNQRSACVVVNRR
jgi:uncharacterized protein YacL